MKKVMKLFVMLIACVTLSSYSNIPQKESLVATFMGIDDEGKYMFEDRDENIILFDEISENVEIDLTDDTYIDIMFSITWEKSEIVIDESELEEGEEKTIKINRILKLEIIE